MEQGATASVASSFADIGRIAAQAAKDLLAGAVKETQVYPDKPRIAVNMASASECGLKLSPELLQKVEKKIP
ncbi:MAG: hypothetical protein A3J70_03240 [Elusimicrobia bacterium RIFCSPHIGHO2_02_FULL_61_10]|nr:MAG: hypothetical protein A3J70_03240 [Elusimicrobia bacterium RIFCSPHIGHO2_02_FULL_61_10]